MKNIVIIGGGIAGLSAGCYARMNGYDAHIFEMHNLPGGLCTTWKRKGYTFDSGIQFLNGSSPGVPWNKIWQELGAIHGNEFSYKEMLIKVCLKDHIINFYNDPDKLAEHLKKIAPEDSYMIDELVDSVRVFYGMEAMPLMKPKELTNIIDIFKLLKSIGPIARLLKKYGKTTIDEFASMFKNSLLQKAMQAIKVSSSINSCFGIFGSLATKDAGFPAGGSLEFARSIEQRFINLGGKIHYNAKIKKILVENKKAAGIQLEDGTGVKAGIVISAADGYSTIFKMLDGKFINKKIRQIYENEPVVLSNLQVAVGVNMDILKGANQDFTEYIYELEEPIMIAGEEKRYMDVRPYSFEPAFAPKGKSTFTVAFPSDSTYWEQIYSNKEKYNQEKQKVGETVISTLEKIIPGVREKIEVVDVATPMTYIRYTNNRKGASMGFANFFILNIPRTLPKLKDFFMAGQWAGDTGLIGAARSGREIIQLICKKDKKRFVTAKP